MTIARSTMADAAYARLRTAILDGQLPPGAHLTVRPLTEEYGLSSTPVKTALTALTREGFLTLLPHRGYFVTEVSPQDMLEIYELREMLDGIAARRAAAGKQHASLAERLTEQHQLQRACHTHHDLAAYADHDVTFHRMILADCGNQRLLQVADNLMAQLRLGRVASTKIPGQVPRSLTEHSRIIEAIASGDEARAEEEVRRHVRGARQALEQHLAEAHPDQYSTVRDSA